VLVIHADLLAQIASGIPVDMKVLVVPTPPEIGDAYGVAAGVAQRPARRPGTSSLPQARRFVPSDR
jgi:long-chain acyl-CoA synthetase